MSTSSPALDAAISDLYRVADITVTFARELSVPVRNHWQNLLTSIRNPTLFQHPAWCEAFLRSHYRAPNDSQPLFACISVNDRPAALVPLLIRRTRHTGMPVRSIELMFDTDMGVRDFPVADGVDGSRLLAALLYQALPAAAIRWDLAQLPDLAVNGAAYAALTGLARRKLAIYHHDSNRLRCSDDPAQPFANVSKNHTKKTLRKRKNLNASGRVEFELVTDPAALPQAFADYIELENAGWKGSAGKQTSLHHDQAQKSFYESLIANTTPLLSSCIAVMRLDDKPIAINVCTRTGDTLWMLKIAYADTLQEYSPGNLILLHLLERFAGHDQVRYISFITGGDWTWRWNPERIGVHHCALYNGTFAGRLAAGTDAGRQLLRRIKHRIQAGQRSSAGQSTDDSEERRP